MAELPDNVHDEVTRLSEDGDALAETGEYEQARLAFQRALELLPPEVDGPWDAAMWLNTSIADMHFLQGHFAEARTSLMEVVRVLDEELGNPFICLRLGQCLLELGEEREEANWLTGAFLSEGTKLFE